MFKYIKLKMSQDTTDFIQLVNNILWKNALERDNWEKLMANVSEGHLREFNLLKKQFHQEREEWEEERTRFYKNEENKK